MNTKEAAKFLGLAPPTVRKYTERGIIPGRMLPGKRKTYFFSRAALENYMIGREAPVRWEVKLD